MTLYGLIGRKLGHSFSADFFNKKFEREHINSRYELFEIASIEGISNILSAHPDLKGLNVTIPYKCDVIPYLDSLTEEAKEIGAVNSIRIDYRNGKRILAGHNTDAPGFKDALLPLIEKFNHRGVDIRKALVLGQGGASKAVIYALKSLGIEVIKVSRAHSEEAITYSEITPGMINECNLIVNCTPLGMYPNVDECPAIPYQHLTDRHLCFDLVYNPEVTKFMVLSAERGACVSNGLQMLHNQAILAWDFWNIL